LAVGTGNFKLSGHFISSSTRNIHFVISGKKESALRVLCLHLFGHLGFFQPLGLVKDKGSFAVEQLGQ
jgi:hypothetical protein